MDKKQSTTFSKEVSEKEFLFTLLASREGICPELISWKRENGIYTIFSKQYPKTLIDITGWSVYEDKAVTLLKKLHSLGIVHCDITEENIVVNPETNDVRLIDFGLSEWQEELKKSTFIKNIYGSSETVDELLKEEVETLEWLFNQKM